MVEIAAASLFFLLGLRSAITSFRGIEPDPSGRGRALMALHETAKAGFWLALGAFFLGYALVTDRVAFRWFVLVPIGMAALRLVAATFLARG